MSKKSQKRNHERYELARSPLAQRPTQRDLAKLLGMERDELRRHASYKEWCITRRTEIINGKERNLKYPVGPLRIVHEKLKFHLNKIRQPSYLFSPRKGRSQRDNAEYHSSGTQYLSFDLKQFYPSTTYGMIKNWLRSELGMYEDVAGLIATLATVDGVAAFGSPLTPVLVSLVHRPMFDEIYELCEAKDLNYSVWVDDHTISGRLVRGELLNDIRSIVASHGHRSHKIAFRHGNRPVFITGIGVVGAHLVAPNTLHLRIKRQWRVLYAAKTFEEKDAVSSKLLAQLGTLRYISGKTSTPGRKAADTMNSLRQKRKKWQRQVSQSNQQPLLTTPTNQPAPWD